MISLASSGPDLNRIDRIIAFTPTDLPEPVVPATSRWGIFARSVMTGLPPMSWPRARVTGDLWLSYSGVESTSEKRTICRRSEEHTSELQSLMRISYAVFCLKKKINIYLYGSITKYIYTITV